MLIALFTFLGILVLLALWAMGGYNALITVRNRYKNAFAQVDVQLQRRYDLIPNLVETAKGYMAHEKETLQAVTEARNVAAGACKNAAADPSNPNALKELNAAETQMGGALSRLMVSVEAYPDLKANQNMMMLQEELGSTENRIAFARQAFNDAVTVYNTKRELFPTNILAGIFGFKEAQLLEIESPEQRQAVKVSF
ncbi:MAG: LemA family protein [Planctomycetia bacterium]|nr:LemA family protein [Planctomycetia bacterium]